MPVGDIFLKDNVALSRWVRVGHDFPSADGNARYFTSPSGEYRGRTHMCLTSFLTPFKIIKPSDLYVQKLINQWTSY